MIWAPTPLSLHALGGRSKDASSTWLVKKILASLLVVGALSSLTVGGTFALLNSQESNATSSIASGTLTFSNLVNTGTACFSSHAPWKPC